jgi:hypothetical protein
MGQSDFVTQNEYRIICVSQSFLIVLNCKSFEFCLVILENEEFSMRWGVDFEAAPMRSRVFLKSWVYYSELTQIEYRKKILSVLLCFVQPHKPKGRKVEKQQQWHDHGACCWLTLSLNGTVMIETLKIILKS